MGTNYTTPIYQLDSETLFLLRATVIRYVDDYLAPRTFSSIDDLSSYLGSISETKAYFTRLKEAIGTTGGSRRRNNIKIEKVWEAVCQLLTRRLNAGNVAKCQKTLEKVVSLFGFNSVEELKLAALTGAQLQVSGTVSGETQDLVAQAFGFQDWFDLNQEDSNKYRTSEGVLMRAYGKQTCGCSLTRKSLDAISQFICDRNWEEYDNPKTRLQVREEIISKLVKAPKVSANSYKASDFGPFKEGDYIRVQHRDGTVSVYHFSNDKFEECFGLVA